MWEQVTIFKSPQFFPPPLCRSMPCACKNNLLSSFIYDSFFINHLLFFKCYSRHSELHRSPERRRELRRSFAFLRLPFHLIVKKVTVQCISGFIRQKRPRKQRYLGPTPFPAFLEPPAARHQFPKLFSSPNLRWKSGPHTSKSGKEPFTKHLSSGLTLLQALSHSLNPVIAFSQIFLSSE